MTSVCLGRYGVARGRALIGRWITQTNISDTARDSPEGEAGLLVELTDELQIGQFADLDLGHEDLDPAQ